MQTIKIITAQNIAIDYEVAGAGERIVARLIDFGIFILISIALGVTAAINGGLVSKKNALGYILIGYIFPGLSAWFFTTWFAKFF